MSFNRITIIGNLGRDPEMKYTGNGVAVCHFPVAVSFKDETTWFKVTAWRDTAERCAARLKKGHQVYVDGPLKMETYEGRDGSNKYTLNIDANTVQFLRGNDGQENEESSGREMAEERAGETPQADPQGDIPF